MKIERILFPVDFSEHSDALRSDVEWLAAYFHAQVTLLNAFEIPTFVCGEGDSPLVSGETLIAYAEDHKQRLREYVIGIPESQLQRVSAEGGASWQIAEWVKDHEVDLIVMGTHGYSDFKRLLLGSVAIKVLHEVPCSVWTHCSLMKANAAWKPGISTIVCSLELSHEAVPLLRFTKELADQFHAKVILVHSVPETVSRPAKYFDTDLHEYLKSAAVDELAKMQMEAGTHFPVVITETLVAQDVAELAVKNGAELIVVGRGVVQETFGTWRTHVCEIIRQAPCPVLSFVERTEKPDHFGSQRRVARKASCNVTTYSSDVATIRLLPQRGCFG